MARSAQQKSPIGVGSALSLLCFLALMVPAQAVFSRLPPGLVKGWAVMDNLIESLDIVSSVLYIIEAHDRLYVSQSFTPKSCTSGQVLHPLVTVQCPLVSLSSLPSCKSTVAPREYCYAEAGSCGLEEDLGNCFNKNVYQVLSEDEAPPYWNAGLALYIGACASFGLTVLFMAVQSSFSIQTRKVSQTCCSKIRVVGLCSWVLICIIVVALAPSTISLYIVLLSTLLFLWALLFVASRQKDTLISKHDRLVMSLEVPVLGALVVFHSNAGKLASSMDHESHVWFKFMLRILQDLPEVVISAVDTYFFGQSWFATFDLAMSVVQIFVHFVLKLAKQLNEVAKEIAIAPT